MSHPEFTRRRMLQAGTAAAFPWSLFPRQIPADEGAPPFPGEQPWYAGAYRRAVIDMHIPDWDEAFLSRFDPQEYAARLVTSRAQSVVCYCQSHVGLFNYPTRVGTPHRAFAGRNMLAEMIDACHRHRIAVQLYTSLVFDRDAADRHPEWRMRTWDGQIQGAGGRHGVLCINSPYREYVREFVTEICQTFEFEGIRFDMTFWPWLCFCEYCQHRFESEVGGELPTIVDWFDPRWVAFQRRREAWLVEFAQLATDIVRQHRPHATVEHQSSTFPLNWMFGVTVPLADQNDFLQGDFYGDSLQGSFVRKLLESLTPQRPFGYETSFSVSLSDHTARKPAPLLAAKAAAAIADQAAFVFIDGIDPVGTVNPHPHARMGEVFAPLIPYYDELGGERVADVAIYYSLESKFDPATSGRHVSSPDTSDSHTHCSMQAARILLRHHIPWKVVTRKSLAALDDPAIRLLILANVHMLDPEECAAIRRYVDRGGRLYASGATSLLDSRGRRYDDFQLADVLGVHLTTADWQGYEHYISPTAAGQPLFVDFDANYPAFFKGYGMRITAKPSSQVLATTTLPWPASDLSRFASIHSNPPWVKTDLPELVEHRFGAGRVIYSAGTLEDAPTLEATLLAIFRSLGGEPTCTVQAPPFVEMTCFHQPDRRRYVLTLVNFPQELPGVPLFDLPVTLQLPAQIAGVWRIPSGEIVPVRRQGNGRLEFTIPRLDLIEMAAIEVD